MINYAQAGKQLKIIVILYMPILVQYYIHYNLIYICVLKMQKLYMREGLLFLFNNENTTDSVYYDFVIKRHTYGE